MKRTNSEVAKPGNFLDDNFLLSNAVSERLYHEYARDQPIIDYHCHLPPADIAANRNFNNITEAWLEGDHYKWRAMRTLGINEHFITGRATDLEKFERWAETVPYTIRNPLYHWTHLELQRYFDIRTTLDPSTARQVYDSTSTMLNAPEYSVLGLLEKMRVEVVCTTDDPVDDLAHHRAFREDTQGLVMLPAFRPDKAILIGSPGFSDYLGQLAEVTNREIKDFDSLLEALAQRARYFHDNGCRLSDHGLEYIFATDYTRTEADTVLKMALSGRAPDAAGSHAFSSAVLRELCVMYSELGWTQQFHLGALRNNSQRMMRTLGPDTGFDSIGDFSQARALSRFLDNLDSTDQLAKTILYNLNPADNEVFATMVGNFNDGSVKGKMQYGSAWWFLDQKDGMTRQLNALSNMGLLSCFVGMLTDSRSFLSFPRHEYFRRLLCDLIGRDVANGELPADIDWLGKVVADICYFNAREYFGFHDTDTL